LRRVSRSGSPGARLVPRCRPQSTQHSVSLSLFRAQLAPDIALAFDATTCQSAARLAGCRRPSPTQANAPRTLAKLRVQRIEFARDQERNADALQIPRFGLEEEEPAGLPEGVGLPLEQVGVIDNDAFDAHRSLTGRCVGPQVAFA